MTPAIDASNGSLTFRTAPAGCVESPAWTSVDAGIWDQMVIRMNVSGAQTAALYWAGDGQGFVDSRAVTFEVSPGQDTYVLDLGSLPNWRGHVARLRLVPSIRTAASTAVDAIFFQTSDGYAGSQREEFVPTSVVRLSTNAPIPVDGQNAGAVTEVATAPEEAPAVRVIEATGSVGGCSTTSGGSSSVIWLLGFVFAIRRRRR